LQWQSSFFQIKKKKPDRQMEKVTLVLGASTNPERYSYKAIMALRKKDVKIIAIGRKKADIGDLPILNGKPSDIGDIHTITLYLNAKNQKEYYDYMLSLNPVRIIFNPGTSNPEFAALARKKGIEVVNGCMLIMLTTGSF
jgi:uncharacterized protein